MTRLSLILSLVLIVGLAIAEAGLRVRRSPQFGQASASATAFGGSAYQRPRFGGPRPGYGGNFGRGPGGLGGPGPQLGSGLIRPGQSTSINIAKSISISTGGGGTSLSQASASSRG